MNSSPGLNLISNNIKEGEIDMPIYTYICKDCNNKFDLLVGVVSAQGEPKCERCGSKNIEKLLTSFSVRGSSNKDDVSSGPSCSTGTCPTCPTCF